MDDGKAYPIDKLVVNKKSGRDIADNRNGSEVGVRQLCGCAICEDVHPAKRRTV